MKLRKKFIKKALYYLKKVAFFSPFLLINIILFIMITSANLYYGLFGDLVAGKSWSIAFSSFISFEAVSIGVILGLLNLYVIGYRLFMKIKKR